MTQTKGMTEAELQRSIMQAARGLGFRVFHHLYAVGSERGYPDLTIVGHGRLFFWELKGPKPKVYPEQVAWIEALQQTGADARIIYPEDYDDALAALQAAYMEAVTA
jgi:hypothetical protein